MNKKLLSVFVIVIVFGIGFFIWNAYAGMPQWIDTVIASDNPESVSQCEYKEQKVYYVKKGCCDMFNDLYDRKGTKICSPDGGIVGGGDGKCRDFEQNTCKVVWKASDY